MRLNNQLMKLFGLIALGYVASKIVKQWGNNSQDEARSLRRKKELQTWEGEGGNVSITTSRISS